MVNTNVCNKTHLQKEYQWLTQLNFMAWITQPNAPLEVVRTVREKYS